MTLASMGTANFSGIVDVDQAYRACQAITKEGAKNFYYAFLTLPKTKRLAIYAAYAFCRLCDDIADGPDDRPTRKKHLGEVRQRLNSAYIGSPRGNIFTALHDSAERYSIPKSLFENVVKGVEMDLIKNRYDTFSDLKEYCHYVASSVGLICIEICSYSDPKAIQYATDLGIAMQLTNIMRDVEQDADSDRIYLPREDLSCFGYSEGELKAGVVNSRFIDLMKFEAERTRTYFKSGARLMPLLDRRARACPATMAGTYRRILERIEDRDFNVFGNRIGLSKMNKLTLMARLWIRSFIPIPF